MKLLLRYFSQFQKCDNELRQVFPAIMNMKSQTVVSLSSFCRMLRREDPMLFSVCKQNNYICRVRKFDTYSCMEGIRLAYRCGLPVISVPLPSREELCNFTLRPITSTVGDFLNSLKEEDKGIDTAYIYASDGYRLASGTWIQEILKDDYFVLTINSKSFKVAPPEIESGGQIPSHSKELLDHAKLLITHLYGQLNVYQYQLEREKGLLERHKILYDEKESFEKVKRDIVASAHRRTQIMLWGSLVGMAVQFGILARLTWWDYSWDIMEPVTYFISYGTIVLMYCYFLLAQQECSYPDAKDRQYLKYFYQSSSQELFDVERYNQLCNELAQVEQDLQRFRDPLQLQLPAESFREEVNQSS